MDTGHLTAGLAPIIDDASGVLVLGSLPSVKSLEKQEYYGNPSNRFWKVLSAVVGTPVPTSYPDKLDFLHTNHIALWDVIEHAERKGSMDSAISNETVNDIPAMLRRHTSIHTVAFNGAKAADTFRRHILNMDIGREVRMLTLRSTSAANMQFSMEQMIENWGLLFKP
jgi:hypoxanthine-DNA glycosylase